MNIEIKKSKVILVEGQRDKNFFDAFIKYLRIEDMQVISIEGKDKLNRKLKAFKTYNIKCLGIVRDADEDAKSAFQSVCSALKNAGFPIPKRPLELMGYNPSVITLIIPLNDEGCLETLCFEAYDDNSLKNCIDEYFNCLKNNGIEFLKKCKEDKAKLQVLLAAEEPEIDVGIAAIKGLFNFDSKEYEPIREFLNIIKDCSL
jgi:5S rRNA maturation endonuclease (ribonuclease M5)